METKKNKKGQEEIVGFAIIVVIVSLIVMFFLIFSLSDENQTESYEADSFLQAMLQHTSSCQIGSSSRWLDFQDLIVACSNEQTCVSGQESCDVLDETAKTLIEQSWSIGPDFPAKGYKLEAFSGNLPVFSIQEGNLTGASKGAQQVIPESTAINVLFNVYYGEGE